MDYKKLLESDSLSLEKLSEMKNTAYSRMPYKFYLILRDLNKPAITEDAGRFQSCKKNAMDFLNAYESTKPL